jgi:hypothetical protein
MHSAKLITYKMQEVKIHRDLERKRNSLYVHMNCNYIFSALYPLGSSDHGYYGVA